MTLWCAIRGPLASCGEKPQSHDAGLDRYTYDFRQHLFMKISRSATWLIALAIVFAIGLVAGDRFYSGGADPGEQTPALQAGTWLPAGRALPDFTLTGADGRPLRRAALQNHWTLVFMGFTHCGDVCPVTLNKLQRVSEQLATPLEVLFVSVDPNRDTPEVLEAYVRGFGPDTVGATGEPDELDQLAAALGVRHRVSTMDGRYTVEHSGAVFLIDPQAEFRALFSPPHDVAALAADLKKILAQG